MIPPAGAQFKLDTIRCPERRDRRGSPASHPPTSIDNGMGRGYHAPTIARDSGKGRASSGTAGEGEITLVTRRILAGIALLGVTLFAGAFAGADDSTSKKVWLLKMEPDRVRRVRLGKEPEIENYFYIPFKLTNEDQEDHSFFLEVFGNSDKGVEYRNQANPLVKELVRKKLGIREGARFWMADDLTTNHEPTDVNAPFPRKLELPVIKAGETVQCVAIFKGPDPEGDKITITFRGLSNDVMAAKTGKANERKLTERVLVLSYERPGDEFYRQDDPITYLGREWKTLERVVKTDLD